MRRIFAEKCRPGVMLHTFSPTHIYASMHQSGTADGSVTRFRRFRFRFHPFRGF